MSSALSIAVKEANEVQELLIRNLPVVDSTHASEHLGVDLARIRVVSKMYVKIWSFGFEYGFF